MDKDTFDVIILIGRPAAGKSEIIDYLKDVDVETRRRRFHIGNFEEIDDFPYVWETFEIDDIFTKHGRERLFSDEDYYFKDPFVWNLLIERINLSFAKKIAADPAYLDKVTAIVEFSRGGENGFGEAFSYLSDEIVSRAGIMYINVSYEESCRKNRKRARKGEEDSILYHSLPDEKMEFYYKVNDWEKLTAADLQFITIRNLRVPYTVFDNEPDVTDKPDILGQRLEETLGRLWRILRG